MTIGAAWEAERYTSANGVDIGAATDNILPLFGPLRVRALGFMCTTEAVTDTATVVLTAVDGATETALKTFVVPAMAVGAEIYIYFSDLPTVPAGSFLKLEVTVAATTGQGIFWIEVFNEPLTQTERAAKTAVVPT